MNKTPALKTAIFVVAVLVLTMMLALPVAKAATMSKSDFQAAKAHVDASYTADKVACGSFSGNAKDVCLEQAKARESVARAELEYAYTGKPADRSKIAVTRANADYAVAKAMCNDKAGNRKDVCVQQAKAAGVKALADAKLGRQIGEARTAAADVKREADYRVATEKCDAFAGDAKSTCIERAKLQFGKT